MSDQTVLIDQFLSSVIGTIHPDEIFDSIIDTAASLLSPDGLLLTIRDDVSPSYHVTRSFGDITWEKDSFLDSSILLEQLLNADSYIPFMPGAGLPTALDGVSSHTRSWLIRQNIIGVYCLKYNRALIGFLFIARHNHMPLSTDQVSALCKIGFYATHALRNANLYMNAYRASITDDLTALYNRKHAFEMIDELCLSGTPCSLIMLDIDDFKLINDIYGHNYGDRALKNLADSMKAFFPSDALLGRNGGDEFCILLPNCTFKEADVQLQQFTKLPKSFSYHGKEHAFYISLGYAEYPTFASNRSQLMRCADAALYEIKLHGKNGCMVYREGLRSGARKQLGFAFKDISEHLPGAFIIYRADKEDDELFFANDEFLHMSGYKDIDELFRLTEKSFRNLIREDEQQQIESSIWEQIDNGNENDYIHFHLRKADGTYFSVLDHGRIIESPQYGKVFYVLFMDWEDMRIRYNDKFAR